MRILHVVQKLDLSWGGLSLFVAEIAKAQAAAGHDVHVVTGKETGKEAACDIGEAVKHLASKKSLPPLISAAEITHIHGLWLPLYHRAARLCQQSDRPYVLSPHGMLEPAALQFSRWRKRIAWHLFQRRDLRMAGMLHATAAAERQTLRHLAGQPIVQAAPGVHLSENRPPSHSKTRTALYLGRLHPIKGIDLLVDAWLATSPKDWKLKIAGPDEANLRSSLSQKIEDSGKHVDIEWLGPVYGERKLELLDECSLVIVPSRSENFAITVIEGLAHSSPVITTTGTPWGELQPLGLGWICEPNTHSLQRSLHDAVSLPQDQMIAMGTQGRAWVENHFQWNVTSQTLVDAYGWLRKEMEQPPQVFID